MALFKTSALMADIKGMVGGSLFNSGRGGRYISNQSKKVGNIGSRNQTQKAKYKAACAAWRSLSSEEIVYWKNLASQNRVKDKMGNSIQLTPFQYFVSAFLNRLILDVFSGAQVAFSLRKLSIEYNGPAIRVRRSADNQEKDIFFIDNEIDTSGLLSFVGSGNGFVTIWYDQSGNNRNAIQPTTGSQPLIVQSGSLVVNNGKPSISFNGSSQFLFFDNFDYTEIDIYLIAASNSMAPGRILDANGGELFDVMSGGFQFIQSQQSILQTRFAVSNGVTSNNIDLSYTGDWKGQSVIGFFNSSYFDPFIKLSLDNTFSNESNAGSNALKESTSHSSIRIGTGLTSLSYFNGNISELVIYNSNQSNRSNAFWLSAQKYYNI